MGETTRAEAKEFEAKKGKGGFSKTERQTSLNPLAHLKNKSCSFKEPSGTRQLEGLSNQGL